MNTAFSRQAPATKALILGGLVVAAILGAFMPRYVEALGDSAPRLLALPAVLVFAMALAFSRKALLLAIIVFRAAGDVALDSTKVSLGGAQIGIGGVINAFVILLAALLIIENRSLFPRVAWRTWGAFLIVAFVGVIFSPERGDAIRLYLQFLSTFAMFVGAIYVARTPSDFRFCLKLVLASSLIPLLYGVYQIATGQRFPTDDGGLRIASTFNHPNILAFHLSLVIAVIWYLIKSPSPSRKPWVNIGLVLYLFALLGLLLFTKTRSAWIACTLMFALYGILFAHRYLAYLAVAGALALLLPGVGDRVFEVTRSSPVISSLTPLNSFQWRVSIWDAGLSWMQPSHYLLGYGIDAFPFYSTTFFREANNIHWGAHNVYVQLFFEVGAIGTAAFVWMFWRVLQEARSMFRFDKLGAFMLGVVIVEYCVAGGSDNMLQYLSYNWYVWFVCGACVARVIAHRSTAGAGVA